MATTTTGHWRHDRSSRFALVLLLLVVTFVFLASAPSGDWTSVVAVGLEGVTLIAALMAADVRRSVLVVAAVVVAVGLASSVVSLAAGVGHQRAASYAISALFVLVAPAAIVRGVTRRRRIDMQTIMGALCVYLFLGMLCAFTDLTIQAASPKPFFAQIHSGPAADFVYFSFVTLTTVGYGDLTPALGIGRAISALEAVVGQLYLVTVVALFVGNLRPQRLSAADGADREGSGEEAPRQPGEKVREGADGPEPSRPED